MEIKSEANVVKTEEKEQKAKMSPPWVSYYRKLEALFGGDPEIRCEYNEDSKTATLYVDNNAKAEAISSILPAEKDFGGVKMPIVIKPSNVAATRGEVFNTAFRDNPVFDRAVTMEGIYSNPVTYAMFNNVIFQYYDDNLGDPHGNYTALAQDLAKDVFDDSQGVMFCTKQLKG